MGVAARQAKVQLAEVIDLVGAERPWFVVCTAGGKETLTKAQLELQGFEVYLPMHLVMRLDPVGRRVRIVTATPFLPGYLFVRVTPDVNRWGKIFSTYGVKRVICSAKGPVGVRNAFLKAIRDQEVEGFLRLGWERPVEPVEPGDEVTTLDGMVRGLFLNSVDAKRITILSKWLGGDRLVTVDLADVVKVPPVTS